MTTFSATLKRLERLGAQIVEQDGDPTIVKLYHGKFSDEFYSLLQTINQPITLVCYATDISDKDIEKLANLTCIEKLGLYSCDKLTDNATDFIVHMTNLKQLSIIASPLSEKAITKIQNSLPNLHITCS